MSSRRTRRIPLRLTKVLILCMVAGAALLASCGGRDKAPDDRPVIAVSFDSQRWIVRQIAGEDFNVVTLLPPGSDPEMFEPDMRVMRALEKAKVCLTTSTLGFEERLADRISHNYPELQIEDVSRGIDIMMHTHALAGESGAVAGHDHGHNACGDAENGDAESHPVGDPHILSSLRNTRIVARNVLSVLNRLNPGEGMRYSRNFERLDERIVETDRRIDSMIRASGKKAFVVTHPSLSYFARDYGLLQIPLSTDGKEVTPRQLEARLAKSKGERPAALFYERGHNIRQVRIIAETLRISAYSMVLNDSTFFNEIEKVGKRFANAPDSIAKVRNSRWNDMGDLTKKRMRDNARTLQRPR